MKTRAPGEEVDLDVISTIGNEVTKVPIPVRRPQLSVSFDKKGIDGLGLATATVIVSALERRAYGERQASSP